MGSFKVNHSIVCVKSIEKKLLQPCCNKISFSLFLHAKIRRNQSTSDFFLKVGMPGWRNW